MKGRKERAQDKGCVGRSQVASKRGGVLTCFRPFLFSLRGWLVSVVGSDGCGAPEESKIGGLTGDSAFWRGAGVGLVGACALMQPSQGRGWRQLLTAAGAGRICGRRVFARHCGGHGC